MISKGLLQKTHTQSGHSLLDLSNSSPVLVVFLRHFGCVFCKEAMYDIGKVRTNLEEKNIKIVLVHMSESDIAKDFFQEYDLAGLEEISNPNCDLYLDFGLVKGSPRQLFGLQSIIRGYKASKEIDIPFKLNIIGDGLQMPGIFVLKNGKVVNSYIHKKSSDRPDYLALVENVDR